MLLLDRYRFGQASKQDLIAKTRELLERYPNSYLQNSTLLKGDSHDTLKSVFAKYKDITKHSNDVETAEIKSLLKILCEEPYHMAVTNLGLPSMLTAVTNAQDEYDKVESQARAIGLTKKSAKRTEITNIYELFMSYTEPVQKPILKNSTSLNSSRA